jgi:hypothetical protein
MHEMSGIFAAMAMALNFYKAGSCRRCSRLLAVLWLCLCSHAVAGDSGESFWVWERREGLDNAEVAALHRCGVHVLYWKAGELTNHGDTWEGDPDWLTFSSESGIRIVPVVRLVSSERSPFTGASLQELLSMLKSAAFRYDELQIDYDCPDRLLGQYAAALTQLRRMVPRLSATALAGWSHSPAWLQLQSSVDELFPMFYDLEADPKLGTGEAPLPLLDPAKVERELQEWRSCKIPWEAGLPSFSRVTLYGSDGVARGHLRAWTWDDVCFAPALITSGSTELGVTLFRATAPGRLADAEFKAGDSVAARWPDREALGELASAAKAAGAAGVVYFRLPDSGDPSGWSLSQIINPQAAPRLEISRSGPQQLVLLNDAGGDLAPRLSGTAGLDRGYALELDAPGPVFRDALEGDFWRVTAHADPDTAPHPVPIPLATRLTFWFSHLRAGESLRTGLIQLAPGADLGQVRYRIIPGVTQWQPIP